MSATAPLSHRLEAWARMVRASPKGLTALSAKLLADDMAAAAADLRRIEATNAALQDELFAEAGLPPACHQDTRQQDLTAGDVVVMPRLFPPTFRVDLHGITGPAGVPLAHAGVNDR